MDHDSARVSVTRPARSAGSARFSPSASAAGRLNYDTARVPAARSVAARAARRLHDDAANSPGAWPATVAAAAARRRDEADGARATGAARWLNHGTTGVSATRPIGARRSAGVRAGACGSAGVRASAAVSAGRVAAATAGEHRRRSERPRRQGQEPTRFAMFDHEPPPRGRASQAGIQTAIYVPESGLANARVPRWMVRLSQATWHSSERRRDRGVAAQKATALCGQCAGCRKLRAQIRRCNRLQLGRGKAEDLTHERQGALGRFEHTRLFAGE